MKISFKWDKRKLSWVTQHSGIEQLEKWNAFKHPWHDQLSLLPDYCSVRIKTGCGRSPGRNVWVAVPIGRALWDPGQVLDPLPLSLHIQNKENSSFSSSRLSFKVRYCNGFLIISLSICRYLNASSAQVSSFVGNWWRPLGGEVSLHSPAGPFLLARQLVLRDARLCWLLGKTKVTFLCICYY